MPRGFYSPYGFSENDKVVTTVTAHHSYETWLVWFYRSSIGVTFPRLLDKQGSGQRCQTLLWGSVAEAQWDLVGLYMDDPYSNQNIWTFSNTGSTGAWIGLCFSLDRTSLSNDPVAYVNGSSSTVTNRSREASGSYYTNSEPWCIGNKNGGAARVWDGMIGPVVRWLDILTNDEKAALSAGACPMSVRPDAIDIYVENLGWANEPNQVFNFPVIGTPESTVTGTVVRYDSGPPLTYRGPRVQFQNPRPTPPNPLVRAYSPDGQRMMTVLRM